MSEFNFLKSLAEIAGIGGISLGILFLLFRRLIIQMLKRKLSAERAFQIARMMIVLIFSISALGLLGYFILTYKSTNIEALMIKKDLEEAILKLESCEETNKEFENITEKSRYANIQEFTNYTTLDLTNRKVLTQDEKSNKVPASRAVWRIKTELVKVNSDLKFYLEEAATGSGVKPIFSCETHNIEIEENLEENRVGGENLDRFLVNIDIGSEPAQEKFTLNYSQVFFNSFQGKTKDWAAAPVNNPTDTLVFKVIFPENKPFIDYELLAYPDLENQSRERYKETPIMEADPDNKWIKWTVPNPRLRFIYRINWSW